MTPFYYETQAGSFFSKYSTRRHCHHRMTVIFVIVPEELPMRQDVEKKVSDIGDPDSV